MIARVGRVQQRLAFLVRVPVEIAAIDHHAADRGAVAADDISSSNTSPPPRHDRTAAPAIGAAVLSMISGMPNLRPIAATSAIGNAISFGFGSVSA